ncbi:MAG: hypothetical protein AAF654_14510 [Myxococcota bacterium]
MSNLDAILPPLRRHLLDLAGQHRLTERSVPGEFAQVHGAWGRTPIELTTVAYAGDGALRRLQVAEVSSPDGAMAALTVVALAAPEQSVPVFGADLVAFRGRFVLAALDLSGGVYTQSRALLDARERLLDIGTPRDLPDFARHCFSPMAAVVSEGAEPLDDALKDAFIAYLVAFDEALGAATARSRADGQAEHARYFSAMRENKRESKALGRLFGEQWAERFFRELFFAA